MLIHILIFIFEVKIGSLHDLNIDILDRSTKVHPIFFSVLIDFHVFQRPQFELNF